MFHFLFLKNVNESMCETIYLSFAVWNRKDFRLWIFARKIQWTEQTNKIELICHFKI